MTVLRTPPEETKAVQEVAAAGVSQSALALVRRVVSNLGRWSRMSLRTPLVAVPRPPSWTLGLIVLTLIAILAAMFLLDATASDWARHEPGWVRGAFEKITKFGLSGWFLIPFGVVLFGLATLQSRALPRLTEGVLAMLAARFGFLFLAIALPGLFVTVIKRLIGRTRPFVGGHDDPFAYHPFGWRPDYASMPSGHATTVAAAAIAIGAIWPRARAAMWLFALLIMFSRVVVLAHHPSDVIGGALVGIVGALLVRRWFAARHLVFSAGDLRAYPGPSRKRIAAALWSSLRSAGAPAASR